MQVWVCVIISDHWFPVHIISICTIIQFQINEKHYSNSLLMGNIENIWFVINLCFDVLKSLLNLQESLYSSTNVRYSTKTST